MPEPISSSNSLQSSSIGPEPDPTLDTDGLVCRSETPPAAPPPPAVAKLISAATTPTAALPPTSPSSYASDAQNNAQRTTERSGIGGYAEYGVTGGARDAVFAGVAALKGRDAKTGIEVEVFSASGQVGGENEAQIGLARLGVSGKHGSVGGEAFTLRAHGGAHNDDGSVGINAGAVATLVGGEGTLTHGANSLTLGASIGVGLAYSVGLRDIDHDGKPELCRKATVGPVTVGTCVELWP